MLTSTIRRTIAAASVAASVASLAPVGQTQRASTAPPFQIIDATVADIRGAYAAGTLTSRQLVQSYLDRIAAYDKSGPMINSVITVNPQALADAERIDAAYRQSGRMSGPLHGIPILVKDEVDTAGMPTTLGTLVFKDYRPPLDAFAVAQLKKAGAIILGKTTLSEFAGGDTYGSMFGITRNPYDLERTVGGSSGGSGAALTANFAALTVGEETSASIRRPGGWNGVVALRPTPGLVSRSGMWDGYPRPQAQMGPMARTVRDLALMLDAMVGYDPEDPSTALGIDKIPASYTTTLDANGLRGARIGIIRDVMGEQTDVNSSGFKQADTVFRKNITELAAAGAVLVDNIVIPDLKALLAVRGSDNESSDAALALYLGRNPGSPYKTRQEIADAPDMVKSIPASKAEQWKRPRPPSDLAQLALSLKARDQLAINVWKVMADHRLDAIVYKTVEIPPTLIKDGLNPPFVNGSRAMLNLNTDLIHAAAMTVPSGFTADGLPVGITLFGRPYSEPVLLKLAYAYEQATKHRKPPQTTPALPARATN